MRWLRMRSGGWVSLQALLIRRVLILEYQMQFFFKQLSVSMSTAHTVQCSLYVHCPLTPMLFLSPLPTQSHGVSMSTAQSVFCCFFVHYPLSLVLFLCPVPTQSRAVSVFIAPSVSCYFCIDCPIMFNECCTVARKSRSSGWHSCFLFVKPQLQISLWSQARRRDISWFPLVPPGNSRRVSQISPRSLSPK